MKTTAAAAAIDPTIWRDSIAGLQDQVPWFCNARNGAPEIAVGGGLESVVCDRRFLFVTEAAPSTYVLPVCFRVMRAPADDVCGLK